MIFFYSINKFYDNNLQAVLQTLACIEIGERETVRDWKIVF